MENIQENNSLIAEFMGLEWDSACNAWYKNEKDPEWGIDTDKLKYHSSWDWLMPVVEKIEQLSFNPCVQFWVTIEANECVIQNETEDVSFRHISASKIEATYKAVLKFIK
jgi:hypothetical protein